MHNFGGGMAIRKMSLGLSPLIRVAAGITLILTLSLIAFLPGEELAKGPLAIVLGIFAAGSFIAAALRRGLVVEEQAGTVVVWSGLIAPMVKQRYPLASITHVRLIKKIVQTGKGPRVLYPVLLALQYGDGIQLWETMDYTPARTHAERLAKVVRRDLHDESSGETAVREEKYLDEPLARRYQRLRLAAPRPRPPQNAVAKVRPGGSGGAIVIDVPGTGFRVAYLGLALLYLLPALLLVSMFALTAMREGDITHAFFLVGGILLALAVAPALITVLHLSTHREVITASGSGIEVESRSWVRRKMVLVSASDIEEIFAPADLRRAAGAQGEAMRALTYSAGARSVLIRTDKGNTGIGRWISGDEQLWLKDLLVHALVSGR
jgi:hypothetical protein